MLPKLDTPQARHAGASPPPAAVTTPPGAATAQPKAETKTKPKPPRKRAASTKPKSGKPQTDQEACASQPHDGLTTISRRARRR